MGDERIGYEMSKASPAVGFRPMAPDDAARVLAWRNLPDVAAQMFSDHHIPEAEHAGWFAAALRDSTRRYWIIELDREPVGLANLYDISTDQKRASLGLYLAADAVRGKGIGSVTDRFLMRQAFHELGLDKLCAEVLATNEPGLAVHRRHGFEVDGVLRRHVIKGSRRIDVVALSLLREEWATGPWAADD